MKYDNTYAKLSVFGRQLLNKKSLTEGLPHISKYVKDVIGAQRCSIFINDNVKDELWTTIADGVDKIIIPRDKGIVGQTLKEKKPILVEDVSKNPHFLSNVDKETGYKTKNILTAPIFNSQRMIIGILEVLNKEDGFDNEDVKFMIFFAHYISGFLELANIYSQQDEG